MESFNMKSVQVWTSSKIRLKPKANKTMPYIDPVTWSKAMCSHGLSNVEKAYLSETFFHKVKPNGSFTHQTPKNCHLINIKLRIRILILFCFPKSQHWLLVYSSSCDNQENCESCDGEIVIKISLNLEPRVYFCIWMNIWLEDSQICCI